VLRNLLGITDAAELGRAEAALSASRLIDLERRRLPGRYDLAHLQAFHRCILGDVYAWAGQLRTVSIAKGSLFCLPQHLESYAADVFGRLAAAERLRGLARDPFVTGLAGFLADVNALHPFREGNGRAQRALSPSSPTTPGITSPGYGWTPTAPRPPAPPTTTATWPRSGKCSTS
jgi:cell filamentation protein